MLSLGSYGGVRNLCLCAGLLTGAETLVLLDDDEVVAAPDLLDRFETTLRDGVDGLAGLYLEGGDALVKEPPSAPWHSVYNPAALRHRAFTQLEAAGQVVPAPFAFGGNLGLSRRLVARVPFDPAVIRGEDVDYVLSARLLGCLLLLDPTLLVEHHPPPNANPDWQQLRQDGLRFLWQRRKLMDASQRGADLPLQALQPYPGGVLSDDLGSRLSRALEIIAVEHDRDGDAAAAERARAIRDELSRWEREVEGGEPWMDYLQAVECWRQHAPRLESTESALKEVGQA
jgi:hypothetical protein